MMKDASLVDRKVLVTAGGAGIGLAIARGFVEAGARVFVCDVDAAALRDALASTPGLRGCVADVADEDDVRRLFESVDSELGGLDVLVNNAGIAGPTALVGDLERADIVRTLEVNVVGQLLCAKHAVSRLRRGRNPSIVCMSSTAGHLGMPARSVYAASKWGVIGLTKSLAIELGREGIRVNAVLPGATDGPRLRAVIAAKAAILGKPLEEVTHTYESMASLGRFVSAEDVADTVLFACSAHASSVTGQALAVDGHIQALA